MICYRVLFIGGENSLYVTCGHTRMQFYERLLQYLLKWIFYQKGICHYAVFHRVCISPAKQATSAIALICLFDRFICAIKLRKL